MFSFITAALAEVAATEIPQTAATAVPEMIAAVTPGIVATAAPEATAAVQAAQNVSSGLLSSPQITAAAIAGFVSLFIALLTNRRENKQQFSNIVSRERMVWVKEVRALCMDLCALCELYDGDSILREQEKLLAFYKARSGLLLHLSPWNMYTTDNELITLLNPLDHEPEKLSPSHMESLTDAQERAKKEFQQVKKNCPKIRKLLTKICKMEWDKVKIESGSSKAKQRKIDALQESLKIENKEA